MAWDRNRIFAIGRILLGFFAFTVVATSCAKFEKPPEVSYVEETMIPAKLAVLPATYLSLPAETPGEFPLDGTSEKGKFIAELARSVIHNQLAGKGYDMRIMGAVDQTLPDEDWQEQSAEKLCETLSVDGLVYVEIGTATMVTAVAYDLFKIEATIKLVSKTNEELGRWSDGSSKRKIAIPTSPVGIASTIAGALLDESARKQMRLVIYDWGWKVCQFMPDNPLGKRLPDVVYVDSNIDKKIFALGDRVSVEVVAEKDLTCSFDLGDFKKNLPLAHDGQGTYKGFYVVQAGDEVSNQPLQIRLSRSNGVERIWLEAGGTVSMDGVLPPAVERTKAQASREGIRLSWDLPKGEELSTFAVEKSKSAVGDFQTAAMSKDLTYLDADVSQGNVYYYRIRSVDLAGNTSPSLQTIRVTMPYFHEVVLSGDLTGNLVSGVYRINETAMISHGNVLDIGAGSKVKLGPDAAISVSGILNVNGSEERPVIFEGEGWKGIVVGENGQANLTDAIIRGCNPCATVRGGSVRMAAVSIEGETGDGVVVDKDGVLAIEKGRVSGFSRGIAMAGGKGSIEASTVTGNEVGLDLVEGDLSLQDCNLFDNHRTNFRSETKVVLEGNYFGTTNIRNLQIEGDVLVKSLLDSPFPHGRLVVLVDDTDITAEALDERFEQLKTKGVEAFNQRRYGDAHQSLTQALAVKADKDVYLYLAYTQSSLGEEENMVETLERGITDFPYEVRLYQIYIKYLAANGQKEKALALLGKAMKMNPEDQNLVFMKQYVEAMGE